MSEEYNWCFACGKDNPIGMKLEFSFTGDEYSAVFLPQKEHQSYDNKMHGGLIATLLDEAMGDYVNKVTGQQAVTARMEVRYRESVPVGKQVRVVSRLVKKKGRLYDMKGELFLSDGTLAAEATGRILLA